MPAPSLRPTALALSLLIAVTATLVVPDADAAKKRKPAAAPTKPAAPAVTACGDFYSFANADWLRSHPAPATGSVSALAELATRAQQQQRDLFEAAKNSPKNSSQKMLGDLWASGMDEAAIERDGAASIAPLLAKIDAIKKNKDVSGVIAALHQAGIPVGFDFVPGNDPKNTGTDIGYFRQGGLGLPDPAFYTRTDADTRALIGRYNGYVQKILALSGTPQARVVADAQQVIDLETRIARAAKSRSAMQDALAFKPIATKDFSKRYRNLALDAFLQAQGVNVAQVSMADSAFFSQIDKLVAGQKPAQWQAYLRYQLASAMAPYLGKAWRDADHDFHGKLFRDEIQQAPRWQHVLDAVNAAAGEMLAAEYMARHFPDSTRQRADGIGQQVKTALLAAIDRNTSMDAATKSQARTKAEAMQLELGGQRSIPDSASQTTLRSSFGSNALIASAWQHREQMKRIGRSNSGQRWDALSQTPAMYYDTAQNRVYVTAAALQAPILDFTQSLASQYGSFGAMLGHEMTHAIDGSGSTTANAAISANTNALIARYSNLSYPGMPSIKIDGTRTRNENAADLSGLELAHTAFMAAEPQASSATQQNFFRGWARLWAQSLSAEATSTHAQSALHAPGFARTNIVVTQLPAFGKAYACKAGNAMWLTDNEQVSIWR